MPYNLNYQTLDRFAEHYNDSDSDDERNFVLQRLWRFMSAFDLGREIMKVQEYFNFKTRYQERKLYKE